MEREPLGLVGLIRTKPEWEQPAHSALARAPGYLWSQAACWTGPGAWWGYKASPRWPASPVTFAISTSATSLALGRPKCLLCAKHSDKRTVKFSVFKLSSQMGRETRNNKQINTSSSEIKCWGENKIRKWGGGSGRATPERVAGRAWELRLGDGGDEKGPAEPWWRSGEECLQSCSTSAQPEERRACHTWEAATTGRWARTMS